MQIPLNTRTTKWMRMRQWDVVEWIIIEIGMKN